MSLDAANELVSNTLRDNQEVVDRVARGEQKGARFEKWFPYQTGKEAYRETADSEPYIRPTYGVRVLIRHDPTRDRGYHVYTAFPINRD